MNRAYYERREGWLETLAWTVDHADAYRHHRDEYSPSTNIPELFAGAKEFMRSRLQRIIEQSQR